MTENISPLLSIITINRNNADGLRKTIESVVTQNCTDFEYIIIDGASTDGSVDIIKEYAGHNIYGKEISYWISESDTGIYNAMNKGIQKAHGTYVYMLNSGDWFEPDAVLNILQKLQNESPDLLLFLLNIWDNKTKIQAEIRFVDTLSSGPMNHQGMIYKKELHTKYGLYNEEYRFAADYDFCIKAFYKKSIKIDMIFLSMANFLQGGLGNSGASQKEINIIQIKNGLKTPPSKIKQIIKYCTPYGMILLYRKIKSL